MARATVWRVLIALAVLATSAFFAITKEPNLGLDLKGGVQIVLETQDSPTREATSEVTDRTVEVLRRRVDALGVAEPTLARSIPCSPTPKRLSGGLPVSGNSCPTRTC